jgi:exodeoxyribonuclease VII large subunit
VITGIGHETDFTIADFVADLRAPTPTAAAELATPNQEDIRVELFREAQRLDNKVKSILSDTHMALENQFDRLKRNTPLALILSKRQYMDEIDKTLSTRLAHFMELKRLLLNGYNDRLFTLNPFAVLGRGYSIVSKPDGQIVRKIEQVQNGEYLEARVSNGILEVIVDRAKEVRK